MESNLSKYKDDLKRLIEKGNQLYYAMALDLDVGDDETKKTLKAIAKEKELPNFNGEYETWYTEAQQVVRQIIPDRFIDFNKLYKEEKRKEVTFLTYTISDYMLGLRTSSHGKTIADGG